MYVHVWIILVTDVFELLHLANVTLLGQRAQSFYQLVETGGLTVLVLLFGGSNTVNQQIQRSMASIYSMCCRGTVSYSTTRGDI